MSFLEVKINTEYIKLQDALKLENLVMSGGEAKQVILAGAVSVNGAVCLQRGKKLRAGDVVCYAGNELRVLCE